MATPSLPQQHSNGQQHFQQYPSSQSQWDGATGAVQGFGNGGSNAMSALPGSNTAGKDAIRDGKERARETMAAAGVSPAGSAGLDGASNSSEQANGVPQLSRKRSRDGSQIPISQASASREHNGAKSADHDDALLDRAIQRDMLYESFILDGDERSTNLIKQKTAEKDFYGQLRQNHPGSIFGPGFMGYGNRTTEGRSQIVCNAQRGPPKGRRVRQPYMARKDVAHQAEQREELVPVRLDIELDKLRLRDTFTWNLHEKLIPAEVFADFLLEDLKVPPEAFHDVARQVKLEMRDQIQNFYPHVLVEDGPLEPGRPYTDHKDDELRILIKLNITIGRITLVDQFEWDINNPLNSPEEFARQMAWENALSGEFTTAIAHTIREQSQLYTKSLWLTNHCFDGRPVDDPDLRDGFLPNPIYSAFRPHQAQKDWMPYMYEMSEAELERTETSMMREHRAQKRQLNRRGGPALPDLKDRQRTVRSLIVHTVIPGAVETFETTGIPKTRRSGRGGRRAGARTDGDVDSDELDSDDSGAESPAPSMANNPGTARTRGMRGAASAAQAAMRAGFGRSETPDVQSTPHETRTASRRSHLRDDEVAAEEDSLIVKLKIGRAKLKAFWTEYDAKKRASLYPLSGYASQPPPPVVPAAAAGGGSSSSAAAAAAAATNVATPSRANMNITPSATPRSAGPATRNTPQPNGHQRASSSSSARQRQQQIQYDSQGRADTDHWPDVDEPPFPPPPWLSQAISTLRQTHPDSDFEPIMRPYTMNSATGAPEKTNLEPGAQPPAGLKVQFLPRIRCNDCPGKLYTAVQGKVVEDFSVHLKNRRHLERVAARRAG